jgi:branched-chain amino acid transport system substrate-binding protein
MPKRARRTLAAVAAAGLVAAACTGSPSAPDGVASSSPHGGRREVKIAYVGAFSGNGSSTVVSGFLAARLAFDQANHGSIGDVPVTISLVPEDTEATPSTAAALAAGLVLDPAMIGVIGPTSSSDSQAAGPFLNANDIPFLTPSAADPSLAQNGWTHWFRAIANVDEEGPAAADYVAHHLTPNCVVVASDDSAHGQGLAGTVQSTLEGDGVTVVSKLGTVKGAGQKRFDELVAAIKVAGCTVVYYGGDAAQAGSLRAQMSKAGLDGVTMVGADGIEDDAFLAAAGKAAGGTIATCVCADVTTSSDPGARAFVAQYTARYDQPPGVYAAESWDIAQMYIAALKAGKTTRLGITDFFRTLRGFQGITKTYSFARDGELDPGAVTVYLYQVQGGSWVSLGAVTPPAPG